MQTLLIIHVREAKDFVLFYNYVIKFDFKRRDMGNVQVISTLENKRMQKKSIHLSSSQFLW